jgi:hypothetical protein
MSATVHGELGKCGWSAAAGLSPADASFARAFGEWPKLFSTALREDFEAGARPPRISIAGKCEAPNPLPSRGLATGTEISRRRYD